jgi:hypothetical protein
MGADSDVRPALHGDLLDGVFTIIDALGFELATIPFGINNRGQMVGAYVDAGGTDPIFLCQPRASAPRSRPQALSSRP